MNSDEWEEMELDELLRSGRYLRVGGKIVPYKPHIRRKPNVGRFKFWTDRVGGYGQKASQLIIIWFALERFGFPWYYYPIPLIALIYAVYRLDKKYIYPGESREAWEQNPAYREMMEK